MTPAQTDTARKIRSIGKILFTAATSHPAVIIDGAAMAPGEFFWDRHYGHMDVRCLEDPRWSIVLPLDAAAAAWELTGHESFDDAILLHARIERRFIDENDVWEMYGLRLSRKTLVAIRCFAVAASDGFLVTGTTVLGVRRKRDTYEAACPPDWKLAEFSFPPARSHSKFQVELTTTSMASPEAKTEAYGPVFRLRGFYQQRECTRIPMDVVVCEVGGRWVGSSKGTFSLPYFVKSYLSDLPKPAVRVPSAAEKADDAFLQDFRL